MVELVKTANEKYYLNDLRIIKKIKMIKLIMSSRLQLFWKLNLENIIKKHCSCSLKILILWTVYYN